MMAGLASKIALTGLLSPTFVGLHGRVVTECIAKLDHTKVGPTTSLHMLDHGESKCPLLGGGGLGVIATVNIESGQSNYDVVSQRGYNIESVDHRELRG